ncbi:MAG: hypothetical protein HKN29_13000 [Rhodothermales bacterium]|nr:hypothetical protein [Rhodothermales bacterium]
MLNPRSLPVFLAALTLMGCAELPPPSGQSVVESAIAWQNGTVLNKAEMTFNFRERHFRVYRNDGLFEYERIYVDTLGNNVREVLSNDGLIREVEGQVVELTQDQYESAETGVNSVVYFALLPLPLTDPAARKELIGTAELNGRTYNKVEVTFVPEGGGRDYDDRFIYWFDAETGALDYLAYWFHVNDGGARFREAYNVREIEGVRIADYYNYKAEGVTIDTVERFDSLHAAGATELVSEVNLENVSIRRLVD